MARIKPPWICITIELVDWCYPSMTAAKAVHVSPMAIPIQGDWPSVPSLRACSDFVDVVFPRSNASVGCAAAASTPASWTDSGDCWYWYWYWCCWSSGNGAGGVTFGTEGEGCTAEGCCVARATVGARQRRTVEGLMLSECDSGR